MSGIVIKTQPKKFLNFLKSFTSNDLVLPIEFNSEMKTLISTVKTISSKITGFYQLDDLLIENKNFLESTSIGIPSIKKLIKFIEVQKDKPLLYIKITEHLGYYVMEITDSVQKSFIYLILTEFEEKEKPIDKEKVKHLEIYKVRLDKETINEISKLLKHIEGEDVKLIIELEEENAKLSKLILQVGETINTEFAQIVLSDSENEIKNEFTKEIIENEEYGLSEYITKEINEDTSQERYVIKLEKNEFSDIINSLNKDNLNYLSILLNGGILIETQGEDFEILYGVQPLI